jgi:hypothetical protein
MNILKLIGCTDQDIIDLSNQKINNLKKENSVSGNSDQITYNNMLIAGHQFEINSRIEKIENSRIEKIENSYIEAQIKRESRQIKTKEVNGFWKTAQIIGNFGDYKTKSKYDQN